MVNCLSEPNDELNSYLHVQLPNTPPPAQLRKIPITLSDPYLKNVEDSIKFHTYQRIVGVGIQSIPEEFCDSNEMGINGFRHPSLYNIVGLLQLNRWSRLVRRRRRLSKGQIDAITGDH